MNSTALGLIIAFAIIGFGGAALGAFAIAHRQRDDDSSGSASDTLEHN